jgi:hypothetical protein
MANLILVRLHPSDQTDPGSFTNALKGLHLEAYDLTVSAPGEPVKIGTAKGLADVDPFVDLTKKQIMQHWFIDNGTLVLESAATAVIVADPPAAHPEYPTADSYDLKLVITRDGQPIADATIDYNVAVVQMTPPPGEQGWYFGGSAIYPDIPGAPTAGGSYVTIPPAIKKAHAPALVLSSDGTVSPFGPLLTAIDKVLAGDPGGTSLVAYTQANGQLLPAQCQQIAAEIVWNRSYFPPPPEPPDYGLLYTNPDSVDDPQNEDNARQQFEGKMTSYYATNNAQATRLSGYVYAASVAVLCEQMSAQAPTAGFPFPLIIPPAATVDTEVEITPIPAGMSFAVPAAYFYALLTTMLSTQSTTSQLYQQVVQLPEDKNLQSLTVAATAGIVTAGVKIGQKTQPPEKFVTDTALTPININQAARRLAALSAVSGSLPQVALGPPAPPAATLLSAWLAHKGATTDIDTAFWAGEIASEQAAYLDLVLRVITSNDEQLMTAITAPFPGTAADPGLGVSTVDQLAQIPDQGPVTVPSWTNLFLPSGSPPRTELLPASTATQGAAQVDQVKAFLGFLQKFFTVPVGPVSPSLHTPGQPGALGPPANDILALLAQNYKIEHGAALKFSDPLDETALASAAADTLPGDTAAQAWLTQAVNAIQALYQLTAFAAASADLKELRFSLMEALYARGFTSKASVQALTAAGFLSALEGTVAYPYAAQIQSDAGGSTAPAPPASGGFQPVNPDGSLTNCVPPEHLSPFGPVAYLDQMLRASAASTCEQPEDTDVSQQIGTLLAARRGPLGELHATRASLETPLPVIDLVNESLEALATAVASGAAAAGGAVFDTSGTELAGHRLAGPRDDRAAGHGPGEQAGGGAAGRGLDPADAFAAIPAHSSPAAVDCPAAETAAYAALRTDFSAPALPYDQTLDICRRYLCRMETSRFETMRRFRKDITEFVLDPAPADEPAGFQRQQWRYPVRFDTALEFLGISAQEYAALYGQGVAGGDGKGRLELWQLYGFPAQDAGGAPWTDVVAGVPGFLQRTGLSYCELVELQRSGFVPFTAATVPPGQGNPPAPDTSAIAAPPQPRPPAAGRLPECEPCCLASLRLTFPGAANADGRQNPDTALYQLIIFIRLWRRLRERAWCELTFSQLAEVCATLALFGGTPAVPVINPDFLRQLAALLMIRDDLRIDPVRLLPLWAPPPAADQHEAVALLLHGVERHARFRYSCRERGPEFFKIITSNLDPLSVLAGFDPDTPGDTWQALPTHALRFAEVLGKIYASDFTVGEILFLFTTGDHLDGDDPFPLADAEESIDDPLALPEAAPTGGDGPHSLWALRRALLRADTGDDAAREWSWRRIAATLREEFGYGPAGGTDPLTDLGEHFFPSVLERDGHVISPQARQYRAALAASDTDAQMWNDEDGPFRYDQAAAELWTRLPLRDGEVIDRLRDLRPLQPVERTAVQELYFAPRATLGPFMLIFENFAEAVEFLVQSGSDEERFTFFQRQFARFHARCRAIAAHLAAHVDAVLGRPGSGGQDPDREHGHGDERDHGGEHDHGDERERRHDDGRPHEHDAAWRVLRSLLADGNLALAPWENDSGQPPAVTWAPPPAGSALAALLGLAGTGLLGEFAPAGADPGTSPAWRETRGPLSAFTRELDSRNCPVPTVLPSLGLTLTPEQLRVAGIRNGFAFGDADGEPLGGAEPFSARWTGVLLVERRGEYRFQAGAPGEDEPDFEAAQRDRWRVTLRRGQKTWVLLSHGHAGEDAPAARSAPLTLRRGAYQITAEFEQHRPLFGHPDEVCPERTGFEVKYAGPDTRSRLSAIPQSRLFRPFTGATLAAGIPAQGNEAQFLARQYSPDLRDIRRTYQRAFKALLLAERFGLSADPVHGYRQSELGYLLDNAETFEGTSYYRTGPSSFGTHHAWLDLDLLPVADPYPPPLVPPAPLTDQRGYPSPQRQAALFDWWERIFDYCWLRGQTECAIQRPAWLLFAEVAQQQPDDPAELLRHLGVDLQYAPLVLTYFDVPAEYPLGPDDLLDERWAVRVWHADTWLRRLAEYFTPPGIGSARPDLWASDDPGAAVGAPPLSGNANLTRFVQDGCLDGARPRRYAEIRELNDKLRERGRDALVGYLCGMNRVALSWAPGGFAQQPGDLSDLLLQDVATGIRTRMSRVEDAVRTVQEFVQRARLGLEPALAVTPAFARLWDERFASFSAWQRCARREMYTENWIEWDDLRAARKIEAFRFLDEELRSATLTVAVPGGMSWWPDGQPPGHPSLEVLQDREPAISRQLPSAVAAAEGLGLLGAPAAAGSPAWLAPVVAGATVGGGASVGGGGGTGGGGAAGGGLALPGAVSPPPAAAAPALPLWLQAAVSLGVQFVRVAGGGVGGE